tara:strand:- start:4271 stop:5044 length:774 start_codon:yes stop_codon:yes gene_type:complete
MSKKAIKKLDQLMSTDPSDLEIVKSVKEISWSNDPTDRTVSSRFSKLKGYLSKNFSISDEVLKKLRPPVELTQKILEENLEIRNNKTEKDFSQDDINNLLSLRTNSRTPFEKSIYLQLVSGRRISELFENKIRIDNKHPKQVKMMLNKTGSKSTKYFTFDLLKDDDLTGKDFKKMVTSLRTSVSGMSLNDFTKRVNKTLKGIMPKLTSHSLRSMYGVYRYHTDNPDNKILTGFISEVLNHQDGSDSGINYSAMKFTN